MCPRAQNHIFCWVHHCTFIFSPDFLRTEFGSEIQIRMTRIELNCILSHTLTYPRARSVNSGRRFLGPEVKFSLQAWKLNNCLQCRELCGNICKMKSHDHLRYTVANYVDLNISRCRRVVRKTSRWRSTTFFFLLFCPRPPPEGRTQTIYSVLRSCYDPLSLRNNLPSGVHDYGMTFVPPMMMLTLWLQTCTHSFKPCTCRLT